MILIHALREDYPNTYTVVTGVEDLDEYIATIEKALEGDENAPKPRAYEVIEVDVTRKVKVERAVRHVVDVKVDEELFA